MSIKRNITPAQCRMARAALDITIKDLARAAKLASNTVLYFERGRSSYEESINAMRGALEKKGARFSADDSHVAVAVKG